MPQETTLGKKIKALRLLYGWSQQRLADESGLKRSHVAGIEGDVIKRHSVASIFALSQALKVHPYDLFYANGYSITREHDEHTPLESVDPDIKLFFATEWHVLTEAEKGILRHCILVIKEAKADRLNLY